MYKQWCQLKVSKQTTHILHYQNFSQGLKSYSNALINIITTIIVMMITMIIIIVVTCTSPLSIVYWRLNFQIFFQPTDITMIINSELVSRYKTKWHCNLSTLLFLLLIHKSIIQTPAILTAVYLLNQSFEINTSICSFKNLLTYTIVHN
jgi:hypothetical protein